MYGKLKCHQNKSGGDPMAQKTKHKPGSNCTESGKYSEYTEDGTLVNEDIDVEEGRRFPPAQEKGSYCQKQKK